MFILNPGQFFDLFADLKGFVARIRLKLVPGTSLRVAKIFSL
jgi:hypothetical protein